MQALKLGFARRVLAEERRQNLPASRTSGHQIWQPRFYDFNVWTRRKRVEKLRYMHRNPVKRELVESPEMWRWSSYRAYAVGETGPVKVNEWEVLKVKVRSSAV